MRLRFLSTRPALVLALLALAAAPLAAQVPPLVGHQGRVTVLGRPFEGSGQFKFALVDPTGATTYWSNDGTSTAGSEPASAVNLAVARGLYSLSLGDTALANMAALPPAALDQADLRLRVWFNDGTRGFQQLVPDQRLTSAPYALRAAGLSGQISAANIADGSIPAAKLSGSLAPSQLPPIGASGLADGAVANAKIAADANIADTKLATIASAGKIANSATTATAENVAGAIVARDGGGGFRAGVITATAFVGDASGLTGIPAPELEAIKGAPSVPVEAWGQNDGGSTSVPAFAAGITKIAAGSGHSLALLADGSISAWGRNTDGQAAVPGGAAPAIALAAGVAHSLSLKTNGTVAAWGRNDSGQTTVPGGLGGVTALAAGERHSLALKSDGTVVAWGDNTFGQTSIPPGLANVVAIAAGHDHSLALRSDGTVVAWGRDDSGQSTLPGSLSGVVAVAAGAYHSLALKNDGTVVAWGWDIGGQSTVPVGLVNVVAIDGGYAHSLAVTGSGAVVAWGDNSLQQLGVPATLSDIVAVSSQGNHSLALRASRVSVPLARLDRNNTFAGRVGIGRAPAANALEVAGNASKSAAGGWLANSDGRIKRDIAPISDALELLARIRPVTFRYTSDYLAAHPELPDDRYFNVIAQEFGEVFPEAVTESGERLPDGSPVLQVDTYPALIAALAAIQELHAAQQKDAQALARENEDLRKELADLRGRLERLEAKGP